jgi:putative endonuclease
MKSTKNKRLLGEKAEEQACDLLISKGYKLIKKNFHAGKLGEIDLIMENDNCIVFVEVKFSSSGEFGLPHYKINKKKQKQILLVAEIFLSQYSTIKDCRLDAVLIYPNGNQEIMEHIEDAFRG